MECSKIVHRHQDGAKNGAICKKKKLPANSWLLNGAVHESAAGLQEELIGTIFAEQQRMQALVQLRMIDDGMKDIAAGIMKAAGAVEAFSKVLFQAEQDIKYASMPSPASDLWRHVPYAVNASAAGGAVLTLWAMVDLTTSDGVDLARTVLKAASGDGMASVRLAVLPSTFASDATLAWASFVDGGSDEMALDRVYGGERSAEMSHGHFLEAFQKWKNTQRLGESSKNFIICGGRIAEHAPHRGASLDADDVAMLADVELKKHVTPIYNILSRHKTSLVGEVDDAAMVAGSLVGRHFQVGREGDTDVHGDYDNGGRPRSPISVFAALDPLSDQTPLIASVLRLLRDRLDANIKLVLLPKEEVSEYPLKSFFRFVAPYDESINDAHAEFRTMPSQQLLTLKISTPEPWVVYPYRTDLDDSIDTDNIKLAQYFAADAVDKSVNVDFVLNNLLVAGECIDLTEQRPPGMQLKLVSSSSPRDSSDTLVMQNLGYWQLKGNPGVWDLRLAEGSSQDLYRVYETTLLSSRDLPTSLNEAQNLRLLEKGEPRRLIVRDFLGTTEQLRVRKQAGMEHVSLLDSLEKLAEDASSDAVSAVDDDKRSDGDSAGEGEAEESSIWSSIQGMLGLSSSESSSSSRAKERSDGRLETIHVFSLATGALYERFLKIMMTSVVKRTKNPVKFWLLGNFISPRFKKAIPRLAEALGFEYALVTYKWPYWLRDKRRSSASFGATRFFFSMLYSRWIFPK